MPGEPSMTARRFWAAALLLVAAHLAALVVLALRTPWTTDEIYYLNAAKGIVERGEYSELRAMLHGPLPYRACRLFAGLAGPDDLLQLRSLGRLGMLPFAAIAALAVLLLARKALGPRGALWALALHVLNPVVLANAPLVTADMALTSGYVLAVLCAWRWLDRPGTARAAVLGIALGYALATKYLALFLVPALGLVLLCCDGRRLRGKALDAGACALAAWAVLWLCYGLSVPGYDPARTPPASHLRAVLAWPPLAPLLSALPEPFLRGIDFQKQQSETCGATAFLGTLAQGHAAYFVVALAIKMPLGWLAALVLGLGARTPRWRPREIVLLATTTLVPLVYLSLFTVLQGGIRYAIAVLPLLGLLAARGLLALASSASAAARTLAWLLLLAVVAFAVQEWPRYTSAFNLIASERPYLWVTDSSLDWPGGSLRAEDRDELLRRHPGAVVASGTFGPRLGTLVVWGPDLGTEDHRDAGRVYHWLRRYRPIDRLGPWFVFDIRPDTRPEDARAELDLAIARLGTGTSAAMLPESNAEPEAADVREALALERDGRTDAPRYAELLFALERYDLLARLESAPVALRARAFVVQRDGWSGVQLLERAEAARRLAPNEALELASAWLELDQPQNALVVLDRYTPPDGHPALASWQQIRRELVARWRLAPASAPQAGAGSRRGK